MTTTTTEETNLATMQRSTVAKLAALRERVAPNTDARPKQSLASQGAYVEKTLREQVMVSEVSISKLMFTVRRDEQAPL